ncbi:MAG: ribosome-associated translation inhibitor RaiA [bacterium]|nr:ribosome-associated translation inhibitor RaiA [bacterium]
MQISISGHHFDLTEKSKSYIEQEAVKLERFYSPLLDLRVTITEEHRVMKASVAVHVNTQHLSATHEAEKLYPAIDGAMEKMARQLKKLHDKRRKPRPVSAPDRIEESAENEE